MTDREIFKLALDCLENAVDLQQSEIDMHILHYGEWYRPQRVEFMKKYLNKTNQSIEAIRARLAQPEQEPVATLFGSLPVYDVPTKQEPVAWMHNFIDEVVIAHRPADLDRHPDRWTALYKDPPPCQTCEALARTVMMDQTYHDSVMAQREWQGLTDKEYEAMAEKYVTNCYFDTLKYARAIEAKLKEKNA